MQDQIRQQSGSALILALIAALLLMIVSFEVAHTTRIEAFIAHNIEIDAALDVACDAGLERALARLREDRQQTEIDSQKDSWFSLYVDTELIESDAADSEFMISEENNEYGGDETERETRLYIETFDESAKLNVYWLLAQDDAEARKRRENFANLIDYFRKDSAADLQFSDGSTIARELEAFLKRNPETEYHRVLYPPTKQNGTFLDLQDLLYVHSDSNDKFWYDLLWDRLDEDGETIIPGLWRYLTVWSDMQININTADTPVLAALFSSSEAYLAEQIVEFRTRDADEKSRTEDRYAETKSFSGEDKTEDPTGGAPFTQIGDLKEKVEGILQETYNAIAPYITVQSSVFTIVVTAERGHTRRSKMWVVRRSEQGFRILLKRPVNFPYFLKDDDLEGAEERADEERDS